MRPDMHRVIISRPRRNRGPSYKSFRRTDRQADPESLPFHESMTGRYGYGRKSQTDLLGPLRKWARKQVGRPWDDVFSEVCAAVDNRTIAGHHLRSEGTNTGHLFDRIDAPGLPRGGHFAGRWGQRGDYYVDDAGILRVNDEPKRWWVRERPPSLEEQIREGMIPLRVAERPLYAVEEYLMREGPHWLFIERRQNGSTVVPLSGGEVFRVTERDALTKRTSRSGKGWSYFEGWHVTCIRYLGRAEKKRLGIG